jgi:hypothetical protein
MPKGVRKEQISHRMNMKEKNIEALYNRVRVSRNEHVLSYTHTHASHSGDVLYKNKEYHHKHSIVNFNFS